MKTISVCFAGLIAGLISLIIADSLGLGFLLAVVVLFTLAEAGLTIATEGSGISGILFQIIAPILFYSQLGEWGHEFGNDFHYLIDLSGGYFDSKMSPAVYWYWLFAVPVVRIIILEPVILVLRKIRKKGADA